MGEISVVNNIVKKIRFENIIQCSSFEMFDRTHTSILRGLAILLIMYVHISHEIELPALDVVAVFGVGIFFLCSGFGLNESYKTNAEKGLYFSSYWKNKLIKVYFPAAFVSTIYCIANGQSVGEILFNLISFKYMLYGWYLQMLWLLYFLYWLLRHLKSKKLFLVIWIAVAIAILFIPERLWAQQAFMFVFGIIVSELDLDKRKYKTELLVSVSVFFLVFGAILYFIYVVKHNEATVYFVNNFVWAFIVFVFCVSAVILSYILKKIPCGTVLRFVGKYSYQLYLLHGLFLFLLQDATVAKAALYVIILLIATGVLYNMCNTVEKISRRKQ